MQYRHLARVVSLAVVAVAAAGVRCPALDRDLVADYGADPAADASAVIQRAVEEVGTAGGGVVHIPGMTRQWSIGRPVFVEYPNVTLAGDGSSTALPRHRLLPRLHARPRRQGDACGRRELLGRLRPRCRQARLLAKLAHLHD